MMRSALLAAVFAAGFITAASAATLLVVDAWFDIMTSPRGQVLTAIVLAAFIELPLAAVCGWLSYHTEHLTNRTIICRLAVIDRSPDRQASG